MAQAKSFFDDVKKEIECPVCQEQFGANKQPKILKCLHTFCKPCLEGWLRQHRTGALSCPTCRTVTECPNNDIDSLPSNLFYKQMVEIVEAYTGQEESSCCGKCDEQKSLKFYCSNCNCLLCEECAALHKKWKDFRGHQLKEIGQLQSSDVEDYSRRTNVCKEHDDEFRFFCESCQICICRDCAILDHDDHRKTSLEKGLEHKTTEIEDKIREVQANGSLLGNKKESLEKRRIKVMNSFERATNGVRAVAEQWITFIRKHEADITEKLMKQKDAFEAEFSNLMSSLDGRVVEIESSLDFGEEILSRRNLPEILNVKEMLENRLQELSVPFEPTLVFPEVMYSSNDFTCLKDGPGKLIRTVTEPTVSVAEGRGLNEAIEGEESTFTVITKDIRGQIVYSEIDQVNVEIISINAMGILTASVSDTKNGRYQVRYRSEAADDFKISVTVRGEAIKDSPFRLQVRKREIQTFHQFHRAEITSMKTGMKAEPKITKMTSKGYTIDVVDPLASRAVKSVQEKKQMFKEIVLTVQPCVTVPMVDEEVFELVSAEICPATVEFLTRQHTEVVLKEIADKTGIKWLHVSDTFMMSGTLKQVEMSRGYLQQAISQYGGIAEYNEMKRKLSEPQNLRSGEAVCYKEYTEEEVGRTNAIMKAKNTWKKDPRDEETDATQTDHMAPQATVKIHDFEVDPKLIKVFVMVHKAELNDIEVEYHVEVPREAKEGKITLNPANKCTGEGYEKACDRFIEMYQQITQVMKMEHFSLRNDKNVTIARKKIHEMGKKFPVLVEVCKDKKHWEVFGRQHDLEEALRYLQNEEVEIEKQSEKGKPPGDLRNGGEGAKDANPSEFAKVSRSKDVLEAYVGRVKVSVSRGDLTTEKVDAIVNASNETLRHDGGLAKAILDKGGKFIGQESNKIIKKRRSLKEGQAVSTKSGDLPCKLVVHAVGPEYRRIGLTQSKEVLRRACFNSLRIAQEEKLTSIALPAIGSGIYGMPKDACAEVMFDVVDEFMRQGDPKKKTITDVRFVNIDDASFQAFRKEFISRYGHTGDDGHGSFHSSPTGAEGTDSNTQTSRRNRGRNKDKSSEANGALAKFRDVSGSHNFETNFHHPLDATASGGSSLPNLSYSGAVKKSTDFNSEEKKMGFTLPPGENKAQTNDKEDDPCPICLDTLTKPRKLKCRHTFCSDCLKQALNASNKCPVCQEPQGVLQGNQPPGEMRYRVDRFSVPGYEGHGTIVIDYHFRSGIQGKEHPHPGKWYEGTTRRAYLPDTREGREVLQLLRRAFDARLVFTIGTSNTTGLSNQITWNDIHHKTNLSGGTFEFGYPDPDYLRRVKEELAAKGIR